MKLMSNSPDIYYTIEESKRTEIKIKGSRFIASAGHVTNRDEAIAYLDTLRAEFYDATHNCFAYRIGASGMEFRASDDGEPSGSAGKPILFMLNKHELGDIIVVVTRYFGGTKLGVGGLARAYSDAADEALKLCTRKAVYRLHEITVFCTYEDLTLVKKLLDKFAIMQKETYHDSIEIIAGIPLSQVDEFKNLVTDQTRGRAGFRD